MAERERPVGVTLTAVLLILIALIGLYSVIIGSGDDTLVSERFANASPVELFGGAFRIAGRRNGTCPAPEGLLSRP